MKNTNKVITYAFNYEHNFLLKAFKGSLGQHLQNKFNTYYKKFNNGETAFIWLYMALSNDNKETLEQFITKQK